jgi:ABC-type glycerol-3-phosphate transport system permease component
MSQGAMAGLGRTSSKRRRRRRRPEIGRFVFLAAFLIFVLGPLYWMFITSIKPSDDYLAVPPVWFPSHPTLVHYTAALFAYRGLQGIVNSLIISISATALSALVGTLMAYSFARFETGGKHLSFWVLSQRFLPPIAIVLPVFLIYRTVGLHDTRFGLVIAYTVFTLPVTVWMMFAISKACRVRWKMRRWSMDAPDGGHSGGSPFRSRLPALSPLRSSPSSPVGPNSSLRLS